MKSNGFQAWGLVIINILARLPFLFVGYGREEDAWSQALNARIIWETGVYEVSRLPGHPIYELLLAGLWPINHSYFLFNFLSTIASSFSVFFFYKILKKINPPSPFWLSLAFSFVPVFFIAGTYTIDYNFGLLFILWSFYSILNKNWIWAGILLGIATGFRISSIGFLLPFFLVIYQKENSIQFLKFTFTSGLISLVCFLPPLLTYGADFLDFHKPPYSSLAKILFKLSFGVWGIILSILLTFIVLKIIFQKSKLRNPIEIKNFGWAVFTILVMQLLVFFRLPFKSEFLIPAIPFLLIFIAQFLSKNELKWLAIASIFSCFFFGFDYKNEYRGAEPSPLTFEFNAGNQKIFFDFLHGPVVLDYKKRITKYNFISDVLNHTSKASTKTWLISGWYWPQIKIREKEFTIKKDIKFDYFSTEIELQKQLQNGYDIRFLPEINLANSETQGHYLADSLGTIFLPK